MTQDARTSGTSTWPVIASTGPSNGADARRYVNKEGRPRFKVGKSKVGGEEVVG